MNLKILHLYPSYLKHLKPTIEKIPYMSRGSEMYFLCRQFRVGFKNSPLFTCSLLKLIRHKRQCETPRNIPRQVEYIELSSWMSLLKSLPGERTNFPQGNFQVIYVFHLSSSLLVPLISGSGQRPTGEWHTYKEGMSQVTLDIRAELSDLPVQRQTLSPNSV